MPVTERRLGGGSAELSSAIHVGELSQSVGWTLPGDAVSEFLDVGEKVILRLRASASNIHRSAYEGGGRRHRLLAAPLRRA